MVHLLSSGLRRSPEVELIEARAGAGIEPIDPRADVVLLDIDPHNESELRRLSAVVRNAQKPIVTMVFNLTVADASRLRELGLGGARRRPDLSMLASAESIEPLVRLLRGAVRGGAARSTADGETGGEPYRPGARGSDRIKPTDGGVGSQPPIGTRVPLTAARPARRHTAAYGHVVIGASTGGPQAVKAVLAAMPPSFPWVVVVVQHIGAGFAAGFASWLQTTTHHPVEIATDGQPLEAGRVLIAPGDVHLKLHGERIQLTDGPKRNFQRPAVDLLFESAAATHRSPFGPLVGVLLTGMGRDGADGCRALLNAGYPTLVQDEASSVVWGMPGVAVREGGASEVLPLDQIGARAVALITSDEQR